ncbi:hypothetical protein FKP32DRAFT_1586909 [Trametes sanguinea]|nr:hypothetical protein FKP32DRAFT_1586909 [Trametes sanguinea]
MLPSLTARVFTRIYASNLSFSAPSVVGVARTFMTTAPVAARQRKAVTADASEDKATGKAAGAKAVKAKTSESKATKAETAEAKAAAKAKAAEVKAKAKAAREKKAAVAKAKAAKAAKAREAKAAARAKAKAKKELKKARMNDPETRFRFTPLKLLKLRKEEKPPRAPKSGFVVFLGENAPKWQAELTETLGRTVKGPDFAKKASQLWNAMSDEEKKPYVDAGLADRERYRKEMDEWFRKSDPRIIRACSVQGRRLAPKPEDVKVPCPPFTQFTREMFNKIEVPEPPPGSSNLAGGASRVKRLVEMWREMPEEEKARRLDAYHQALAEWRQRKAPQA